MLQVNWGGGGGETIGVLEQPVIKLNWLRDTCI